MQCACGAAVPAARAALGYQTCLDCGERDAQVQKIAKSRRAVLLANKSTYGYLTDGMKLDEIGKKH